MRRSAFFIATENHARTFLEAMRLGHAPLVYLDDTGGRADMAKQVIDSHLSGIEYVSSATIFQDILSKDFEFFFDLELSDVWTHRFLWKSGHKEYLNAEKLDSRVLLRHEGFGKWVPGYIPKADRFLCTNRVYEHLCKQNSIANFDIVGETLFDNIAQPQHAPATIMLTTFMFPGRAEVCDIISDVLVYETIDAVRDGRLPQPIYIKDHPFRKRGGQQKIQALIDTLVDHDIAVSQLDSQLDIWDLSKDFSHALVLGSPSSHFLLHALGVESYLYYRGFTQASSSESSLSIDNFADISCMPDFELNNHAPRNMYQSWFEDIFYLDGRVSERLSGIMESAQ